MIPRHDFSLYLNQCSLWSWSCWNRWVWSILFCWFEYL